MPVNGFDVASGRFVGLSGVHVRPQSALVAMYATDGLAFQPGRIVSVTHGPHVSTVASPQMFATSPFATTETSHFVKSFPLLIAAAGRAPPGRFHPLATRRPPMIQLLRRTR